MPTADDIDTQRALLQAHRQTLGVLLQQQARLGAAYAPPGVAAGIAEARAAVARIKQTLREWAEPVEDLPDDEAPSDAPGSVDPDRSPPAAARAGGDLIVGTVGAGAQGVAIGKNIRQTIGETASQQDDRREIADLLARLDRDLAANASKLDPALAGMAAGYARLLAGELSKTERAAPSASAVMLVGDWLLDNVPPLRPALNALFTAPAVCRTLARADAPLDEWLRRRFGA